MMKNVDAAELYVEPGKFTKRRKQFVMVPWVWVERLAGAGGQTYALALHLLYRDWKNNGAPIKLRRVTKRRALAELERRQLISVDRQDRKAPTVRLL